MDFGKLFESYGLAGIVIATLFFIVWRMLVWVMAFVREQNKQQIDERTGWLCTINRQNDLLLKISDSVDDHDKRADERGRFVRDEHKQMISNLEEQAKVLVRINGYKNDKQA